MLVGADRAISSALYNIEKLMMLDGKQMGFESLFKSVK